MSREQGPDPRDVLRLLISPEAKFPLGQLCATPGALEAISPREVQQAILRHQRGDWGDLDQEDREANELALQDGSRLFSVYHTPEKVRFYVITEWDRSVTTVLLPEEY